jgi:hypothetical protein
VGSRQITQANLFTKKIIAPIGKMGLAGKILGCHWGAGVAAEAAWAGRLAGDGAICVSGTVVRFTAVGSVGKYSGPCWPQADRLTALLARTIVLTRICKNLNMVKL